MSVLGIVRVDPNPLLYESNQTSTTSIMWIIELCDIIERPLIL